MFDMHNIGRTIASARKAHNMTQMELADRLNISFQAISNWERGISMPDIAKLPEVAEILELSIDNLLGKPSPLINGLLSEKKDEYLQSANLDPEEILEATPILKPSQVEDAIALAGADMTASDLTPLLPFLRTDFIDELADKVYQKEGIGKIAAFLPFLSQEKVDAMARCEAEAGNSLAVFLPFISKELLHTIVREKYESQGVGAIAVFLPFLEDSLLHEIAKNEFSQHGLRGLTTLLPFLGEDYLTDLIKNFSPA